MKKIKHEAELLKMALRLGMSYAEKRGVVKFDAADSINDKIEYVYKLLVYDKLIQPLAKDQISIQSYKHKLSIWMSKKLPSGHELLK